MLEVGGRNEQIQQEVALQRAGRVIPPNVCPTTPPHIEDFDSSYMVEYSEEVVETRPDDCHRHQVTNCMGKQKMVEEAREDNPYEVAKDLGVDYRFWNVSVPTFMHW